MTDTTKPQDAQETPQDATEATEGTELEEVQDAQGEPDNPSREAARYRRKLRETETERDQLAQRIESLQRSEVERHAGHLARPSAIWAAGVTVSEVLNENGDVDPNKVTEAVIAAADQLGLAHQRRAPKPNPAQRGEAPVGGRADDMANVIQGIKGR